MPSFNVKDYVLAAFLLIIIGMGITIEYYEVRNNILSKQLTNIELLKEEAERKTELIEKRTEQERKETDEQYENRIATLNADIRRVRNSNTSLMPTITKSTKDIERITFQRDKLTEAIDRYRNRVQDLVAKSRECEIKLEEIKHWWYDVETLYE